MNYQSEGINDAKVLKFLRDAVAASSKSKDRSTQVGAVALDANYNVLVSAWNGFPRGVDDNIEARHERPAKYQYTSHTEENLVAQAAFMGKSLRGSLVLVTALHPCTTCSRLLVQSGVSHVFAPDFNIAGVGADRESWDAQAVVARQILAEGGVKVVLYPRYLWVNEIEALQKHNNDLIMKISRSY